MCRHARRVYCCDQHAPGHARGFCTAHVTTAISSAVGAQPLVEDLELIVSELVANAIHAECTTVTVDATCTTAICGSPSRTPHPTRRECKTRHRPMSTAAGCASSTPSPEPGASSPHRTAKKSGP